jgi:hypothetical protein
MGGFIIFFILFFSVQGLFAVRPRLPTAAPRRASARLARAPGAPRAQRHPRRAHWERALVQFMCQLFVASWTGVIRYHGPRPVNRPNHVWVCNHTSMIDYIILCSYSPFAVIMQLHPGWVGFLQTRVLNCLGCLWFNRTEARRAAFRAVRAPAPPDKPYGRPRPGRAPRRSRTASWWRSAWRRTCRRPTPRRCSSSRRARA